MAVLKHVGKYGEKPCVVLFRELPGEPENCLIIQTGTLEPQHHDDLMVAVQSAEAQQSNDISQVLHRKTFTDGSNMLNYLHFNKKLQKVPVAHVSLTPTPAQSIPLSDVNAEIRKIEGGYVPPKTDPSHLQKESAEAPAATQVAEGEAEDVAVNLLRQAELMEGDAKALLADAEAKRAEAYKLNPELVSTTSETPKRRGRPKKSAK